MLDNKTIKTPSGKEVVFKNYLTARGRNQIRNIYLNNTKVKVGEATPKIEDINVTGEMVEKAETELIKGLVLSFDGSAENILDRILDGSPEDYDFIIQQCNEVSKGDFQKAK